MRKHLLGASLSAGSWSPRFARSVAMRREDAVVRAPKEVCRFTTIKRGRRSISLFFRPHIMLATLLEADPEVAHWNSAKLANDDGMQLPASVHFVARGEESYQAFRVGGAFDPNDASSLRMRGFVPRSVTPAALARDPRLPSAEALIYYRSQPLPAGLVAAAVLSLSDRDGPKTLGQLRDRLHQLAPSWDQILTLVGAGYVHIILAERIDEATPITGMSHQGWL